MSINQVAIKRFGFRMGALLLAILMLASAQPQQVFGYTAQQRRNYINKDIVYVDDADACVGGDTAARVALVGSGNQQQAFNFFVSNGLTAQQAAGILGNLIQESGVNPKSVQSGGPGRGIAQWSAGGRWDALQKWAASNGQKPLDLSTQLGFLWYEMTKVSPWKDALVTVKAAKTVSDAAVAFHRDFEKSADSASQIQERVKSGEQVLAKYGNGAPAGGTPAAGEAPTCGAAAAGGFPNGAFVQYDQCGESWSKDKYGPDNICTSGCGPTALAMIVATLKDKRVTPREITLLADKNNMYTDVNVGSSWEITPLVAKTYGLKARKMNEDVNAINAVLKAGGLIITSGKPTLPFTTGGHFIVIRAVTASGKWLIGDSGNTSPNSDTKEWDTAQIMKGMNENNIYAITK